MRVWLCSLVWLQVCAHALCDVMWCNVSIRPCVYACTVACTYISMRECGACVFVRNACAHAFVFVCGVICFCLVCCGVAWFNVLVRVVA